MAAKGSPAAQFQLVRPRQGSVLVLACEPNGFSCAGIPVLLLFAFGGVSGYESVKGIEGLTAASAAENVFARLSQHMDVPVELRENLNPPSDEALSAP